MMNETLSISRHSWSSGARETSGFEGTRGEQGEASCILKRKISLFE